MNNNTPVYAQMVKQLAKPGLAIYADLTPATCDMWHAATGIAGEAGELLDAIKKAAIYNKKIDYENVIEELGDLEFYMELLRQTLGINRQETLTANVRKLSVRYAQGYTDNAAQIRADKAGEAHE